MNKERELWLKEKEVWLKKTYDYLKNTDFDKVECQSDIYLDYIMLYEEKKVLQESIHEAIEYIYLHSTQRKKFIDTQDRIQNQEPKFYGSIVQLLEILKGDSNE